MAVLSHGLLFAPKNYHFVPILPSDNIFKIILKKNGYVRYCWQRINQLRAELYEEERICLRKSEKKQEDYRRQGKARKNIGA